MHGDKRRGRSRTRVLYWFRTPPGVRVGRAPLDAEAIRLIETHNPAVAFDWSRILKGESEPEPRIRQEPAERRPRPERGRPERRAAAQPSAPPVTESTAPAAPAEPVTSENPADAGAPGPSPMPEAVVDTPAGRRLGAEALGRLRARYAEVTARILERPDPPDAPGAQDELKARAERLNPDAWVTDGEVAAGLEEYEAVYESLRAVVGRRRDRRGRG